MFATLLFLIKILFSVKRKNENKDSMKILKSPYIFLWWETHTCRVQRVFPAILNVNSAVLVSGNAIVLGYSH